MSALPAFDVKGWCPGALRPMESGDGLLMRIKPWCGSFTLAQAAGLADIAVRLGNGHIDLTRRANLQIRGMREEALPELHEALDTLGLLDADAATEAARNVMVGPLADANVRALAKALTQAIVADHRLAALPAKFGWLVDGGGPLSIIGERADVALSMSAEGVALRAQGTWCGIAAPDRAVKAAIALALGERPLLAAMHAIPSGGARLLAMQSGFFGVGVPFGRLDAAQLAALSKTTDASEMRLSPWRALYIDAPVPDASALGLIVDENDPLLRIEACPGAPACTSSSVDTRGDARRLAARGFDGTIHVSGCAKGCARSTPADLVLVGEGGRYGVVHDGTTRDPVERTVTPEEL
jgi:precorrin-3B synthase